jgi:hypothetical protein
MPLREGATLPLVFAYVSDRAERGSLTVQHVGSTLGTMAVSYATANRTATSGLGYTSKTGTLNSAAGDGADRQSTITILPRVGRQPNRNFTVILRTPTGATLGSRTPETVTVLK